MPIRGRGALCALRAREKGQISNGYISETAALFRLNRVWAIDLNWSESAMRTYNGDSRI